MSTKFSSSSHFISNKRGLHDHLPLPHSQQCRFTMTKPFRRIDHHSIFLKSSTKYVIPRLGMIQVKASSSSSPNPSSSWLKWLLGILFTLILPAAGHKGGIFLGLKRKIDQAIQTVEHVTEVVEEVAEEAEKLVEEVESKLPGDSKLREALESLDDVAKKAVKEAKKAEDLVHKVKDMEAEMEEAAMKGGKDAPEK